MIMVSIKLSTKDAMLHKMKLTSRAIGRKKVVRPIDNIYIDSVYMKFVQNYILMNCLD